MRRLTVHLEWVDKEGNKVKNTLSFEVKNDDEIQHHLSMHGNNVKKSYITNL